MRARDFATRSRPCPRCGYDFTGLAHAPCPECGGAHSTHIPLSWRVAAVDIPGLFATVGVNVVLVGIATVGVLVLNNSSWFTDPRFKLGRGPDSISGLLLYVLALSFLAWGAAWQSPSEPSWRWQNALALWCWLLTAFHAVGCASVLW